MRGTNLFCGGGKGTNRVRITFQNRNFNPPPSTFNNTQEQQELEQISTYTPGLGREGKELTLLVCAAPSPTRGKKRTAHYTAFDLNPYARKTITAQQFLWPNTTLLAQGGKAAYHQHKPTT